jgi:hypothetical protein
MLPSGQYLDKALEGVLDESCPEHLTEDPSRNGEAPRRFLTEERT